MMVPTNDTQADLMACDYFELQKRASLSNSQAALLFGVSAATIRGWRSGTGTKVAPKSVKSTLASIITGKLHVTPMMATSGALPPSACIDERYHKGVSDDHKQVCDVYAEHGLSGGGFFESLTQGQYKEAYERAHTLIKPHFDAHMAYTHQFQAMLPKDDPLYRPLGQTVYNLNPAGLYRDEASDIVCDGSYESTLKAVRHYGDAFSAGYYKKIVDIELGQFDRFHNRKVVVTYIDCFDDEETTEFYLVPKIFYNSLG